MGHISQISHIGHHLTRMTYLTYMTFAILINPEIKLYREHGFMVSLIKFDILQVLHDGSLVFIAAIGRAFCNTDEFSYSVW